MRTVLSDKADCRSVTPRPSTSAPCRNHLLGLLPEPVAVHLGSFLHRVELGRKQVLFRPHERLETVYFPETAVVSLVERLRSGDALDVGLIGCDGMVGTAVLPGISTMPCEAVVQIGGVALRVSADVLRQQALEHSEIHNMIDRYAPVLLSVSMQAAICNRFHSVEAQCARWLLTAQDLVSSDELPVTQYLLAEMLGVQRPTITLTMRTLAEKGCIENRRGRVRILNRDRMQAAACECYGRLREEHARLLSQPVGEASAATSLVGLASPRVAFLRR